MEIIYKLKDFPDPGDRDLYKGIQEINRNNYKKALQYFEKSSAYDNEYGSLFTAVFYFTGYGLTERNPLKALELFKVIASVWNNRVAQYLIGVTHYNGDRGISMDKETGIKWTQLAADNGCSDAMTLAGYSYSRASDEKNNINKAIFLLEKVASNDDTDDEFIDNGTLYLFGNKDFELSMTHVKPKIMGILNSKDEYKLFAPIEYIKRERDPIVPDSEEFLLVKFWISLTNRKSSGVATAQTLLSCAYISEFMGVKNVNKALYWAQKAAKNEEENIFLWLTIFYSNDNYFKPDYTEAMKWFEKASNVVKNTSTRFYVTTSFHVGEVAIKNCEISNRKYEEYVTRIGPYDGPSYVLMGDIYTRGKDGVPQDYRKAHGYFLKAYELGYCEGATLLGGMYYQGQGVEENTETAFQWFEKGAAMGSSLAAELILKMRMH